MAYSSHSPTLHPLLREDIYIDKIGCKILIDKQYNINNDSFIYRMHDEHRQFYYHEEVIKHPFIHFDEDLFLKRMIEKFVVHYRNEVPVAPTKDELAKHPPLKNAWEEYMIIRRLLGL